MYSNLLEATLEYGEGHARMVSKDGEPDTKNFDCSKTYGRELIDYHIQKISYSLKSNEYIESLKAIYKNRNTGEKKTLLDTAPEKEKNYDFEFQENEEIAAVRVWLAKDRLIGFEITTTLGTIKKIGYGEDQPIIINQLENKDKIVFGFGGHANDQYGVCSIYFYYMDKKKFGIIHNSGLLQLRAKLKEDQKYKDAMSEKKASLTPKQNLIFETCNLPDTAFFPVASYIMSY